MPKAAMTCKVLPTWHVGFPRSKSTIKRSPVPETIAKEVWVKPCRFRDSRMRRPMSAVVMVIFPNGIIS